MPFPLHPLLGDVAPEIAIVDIGAMHTERERYAGLAERAGTRIVGFEPDDDARSALVETFPDRTFLRDFVGDGKRHTFYRCFYPGCSSLYRPDPAVIDLFTGIATSEGGNFAVVGEDRVETRRLDDVADAAGCDFLKIDVQGAELDVLQGAIETLSGVVVVETEVEFVPVYQDQPLFADIDAFLRGQGFALHRLIDVSGRAFRPFMLDGNYAKPVSQLLWADAVYVKGLTALDGQTAEHLLKLAILAHELYGSADLTALALGIYDGAHGTDFARAYLGEVAKHGVPLNFMNVKDWSD